MVVEDGDSLRARVAAAAREVKPLGRNTKAEQVREVIDLLEGYKKRYPKATAKDLQRVLDSAGLKASPQTIRDVLKGKD